MTDDLIPQWSAPVRVRALCTTRGGGVSQAPYDSFNLGEHVGDAPQAVAANRETLVRSMAARPVFLSQVHGTQVMILSADSGQGMAADASLTKLAGIKILILVVNSDTEFA